MEFIEQAAPRGCEHLIECVWTLTCSDVPPADAGLVTPDGCVELVFGLDGSSVAVERRELSSFVLGLTTRPQRFSYSSAARLLGVRLRLAGALRMFGADLATLVDRAVAAVDVLPTALRPLCSGGEHVASERLIDEVVACVRRDAGGERTSQAIERIQRCNGRVEIAEVARGAGVSTRQLDRDFERFVGISPKLVARIARFRRVFERSHSARRGDWTLLADAAGYADQAHMTREFREFAGMAPDAWRRQLAAADV